jgi:hypothetical protein
MSNVVAWNEVLPIAAKAFRIWTGQPELRWAEEAWAHLTKAGLAANLDQLDRLRAYIRLLDLASIYRDWCALVWDEVHEDEPEWWLTDTDVEVSPVQIGQLLGPEADFDVDDGLEEALKILMARERDGVVAAILEGFGSDADLFLGLWRSSQDPNEKRWDDDEDDRFRDPPETDGDIVNDVTTEKMAGYQWILEGCPWGGPIRSRAEMDD